MEHFNGSEMLYFRPANFLGKKKKVMDYLDVLTSYLDVLTSYLEK